MNKLINITLGNTVKVYYGNDEVYIGEVTYMGAYKSSIEVVGDYPYELSISEENITKIEKL